MEAVLLERNFRLFWIAGAVSVLGDWILWAALPFAIYRLTGSALATGAMFIVQTVPALLLGSVAGVFVDRWERRRVVVVAEIACAVLLLPLLALHTRDAVWLVYVVGSLLSCAWQFYLPASGALLPQLVEGERLVAANALSALTMNAARLIGPPLGGLVFVAFGLGGIALADSASFLVAAGLTALVTVSTPAVTARSDALLGGVATADAAPPTSKIPATSVAGTANHIFWYFIYLSRLIYLLWIFPNNTNGASK